MTEGKCAIWGTPAVISSDSGPEEYDSPRAGGRYKITRTAKAVFEVNYSNDLKLKLKLTSWLVEQRRLGDEIPLISEYDDFLLKIKSKKFLSTSERIDNFFYWCLDNGARPGNDTINLRVNFSVENGVDHRLKASGTILLAVTESENSHEFDALCGLMKELGYLASNDLISAHGFQKIEELERSNISSKQAFVAMWFDSSVNNIYEQAIAPAIRDSGFDPIRIDRKEHNNKIDDEIIAELRRSRFVIADFTSAIHEREGRPEAIARGGVYYEAGFAHGMGIPVIWTCRSDMIGLVHFDTRQYNHIDWKDAADLKKRLYDRIRATIT